MRELVSSVHRKVRQAVRITNNLDRLEKIATIGIFICTILATTYAVKVSRQTIKVIGTESRPWLAPMRINTCLHKDMMTVKVEIENVGKIPAFASLDNSMNIDDKMIVPEFLSGRSVIMPGQVVKTSFAVKDTGYQQVLAKKKKLILVVLVNYTDEQEKPKKYYTHVESEFNPSIIPSSWDHVAPLEMVGIWTIRSADFH